MVVCGVKHLVFIAVLLKRKEKKNFNLSASFPIQGTIANSLTCVQLHKRAEKIAVMLMERGHLQDGDHVALVYPPGKEQNMCFQW